MEPKAIDINCVGYSVRADIYEGSISGAILLSLIGKTSRRNKQRYRNFLPKLAKELGITSVIFDYTGHGDSPFSLDEITPAQHFLEVVTVFDWMKDKYPNRKFFVVGSSYGGFLATQLTKYRKFDGLILQAPAIYKPEDFYTKEGNLDDKATFAYRHDKISLANNPLLKRASNFGGEILLMVHKRDERIPKETTDAYANALHPEVVVEDVPHSLGNTTDEQVSVYNQKIFNWLEANLR